MEVDVSDSLRDPRSDQIAVVKVKAKNHTSKTEKHATVCEINKSDDADKSGENCMADVANSNSIEAKCSGEVQPKTKKERPRKIEREALRLKRLNGQCKSSCGDGTKVHGGTAAVNGTNLPGGSDVDNNPDTRGDAVAENGANLQTTKRKRRKRVKRHDCNDSENVEVSNTVSNTVSTGIECRSSCRNCIPEEIVGTEGGLVTENVTDFKGGALADGNTSLPGGAVADRNTVLPGDAVAESGINLHGQKRKRRNRSKSQKGNNSNNFEVSNTISKLNSEFKASCENYTSKETIVTENGVVTESNSDLQGKKKKKKKRKSSKEHNVNIEALCEEENPKSEQISLPSSPIRDAMTEAVPLSGTAPTENDGSSSSGTEGGAFLLQVGESSTNNSLVPKELVPPGRKKLLVLDVNGLLADINTDFSYTKYADYRISGKLGRYFYY